MSTCINRACGTLLGVLVFAGIAHAGDVNQDHGLAIKGYDPVAYFTDHMPVMGSPDYKFSYEGATYEFASEAHRHQFADAPETYVPQFAGFCAYGVSAGHKADIDPTAFTIVDGKLYLNYTMKVRDIWKQDIPGNIQKAREAWPQVSQQTEVIH
jgi:YHS domain-containing protein